MARAPLSPADIPPAWVLHTQLLLDSYFHLLGRELIRRVGTAAEQAAALFDAPVVVVSHDTQADPILNYGNRAALALWEMDVETLLRTPSRRTAEPARRDERARFLQRTARDGFVENYSGIRISATGRRFRIIGTTIWNLLDPAGRRAGQAAAFSHWEFLDD